MASIIAISNLLTTCNAVATSPTESIPVVSTFTGAFSFFIPDRGYSLTKAEMWKPNQNGPGVSGFQLTFSPDCCGGTDIVQMYGSNSGGGN